MSDWEDAVLDSYRHALVERLRAAGKRPAVPQNEDGTLDLATYRSRREIKAELIERAFPLAVLQGKARE